MARIQLPRDVIDNKLLFHPYVIEDSDRPDTIADLYYGDSYYDWIVLLSNKIVNLRNEWPLTAQQFGLAINSKYGSHAQAMSQIDHYKINTNIDPITAASFGALTQSAKKYFTEVSGRNSEIVYGITRDDIKINSNSYAALDPVEQIYWTPVNAYDAEYEVNETKRAIRLIDARYVQQLEKSLRQISKNVS